MRWIAATLEATRQAMVLLVVSRMFVLLLGICAAGAVAMGFLGREAAPSTAGPQFFGLVTYALFLQFGLPFAVLYFGVVALHEEIADRTATYVFARPVKRSSLLIGKWLSVVVVGSVVCCLAMTMLFLALVLPGHPWSLGLAPTPEMLLGFVIAGVMAVVAYSALGVCFGAVFRRPLICGIAFVIGWEFLVSHTPPRAGIRDLTVADPIRRWLIADLRPSGPLRDALQFDPLGALARRTGVFADQGSISSDLGMPVQPFLSLGCFTAVLLGLALWAYTSRDYDARPRQ